MKIDIEDIKKFTIESDEYLVITVPMETSRNDLNRFRQAVFSYFDKTSIKSRVMVVPRGVEFEKLKIKEANDEKNN